MGVIASSKKEDISILLFPRGAIMDWDPLVTIYGGKSKGAMVLETPVWLRVGVVVRSWCYC